MIDPETQRGLPSVFVHVTAGGILEVVCSDGPVRVICVDFLDPTIHPDRRVAPCGDAAVMWEEIFADVPSRRFTDTDKVRQYDYALAAPPYSESEA